MPFAAVAAGVVAAGAGIAGAVISGNAAQSAAQTQANAANNASQVEQNMFNTTQANLAPYMNSGGNALTALQTSLGIGSNNGSANFGSLTKPFSQTQYQMSPGAQFQLQQGTQADLNAASATGGVLSGNTLKALNTFGQGVANTDYYQALNAYMAQQNQNYNMLAGQASQGENAAANLGNTGAQVASTIGGNTIGAGNALAAGTVGSANALTGALNNGTQLAYLTALQSQTPSAAYNLSATNPALQPYSGTGVSSYDPTAVASLY